MNWPVLIRLNGGLGLDAVKLLSKSRSHLLHVRILLERVIITNLPVVLQLLNAITTSCPVGVITPI